eukprot:gnl/MRDRNA2_/MRDRNA2_123846_c0_seq1.p1 gnl/MRDRNA2_/MRDRNA2_123846_c0~~gnl/MRDRNA2_/MRDRNA2_123846_c0_seq1.p1  ORF type:complete len:873 (-),score=168.66 gnl/MRDRNA2_/MRDRNA2_123846_c0_seq1:4-2622(-)
MPNSICFLWFPISLAAPSVLTGSEKLAETSKVAVANAGSVAEKRLEETRDHLSSFLGRSTSGGDVVDSSKEQKKQVSEALVQRGPVIANGDFNAGPYECKRWAHLEKQSAEDEIAIFDDDAKYQKWYEENEAKAENHKYSDPVFCNPEGWSSYFLRQKSDQTWALRQQYDEADDGRYANERGVYQVNLASTADGNVGRMDSAWGSLARPTDPKTSGEIKCPSSKECWWMLLLNNAEPKHAISQTEVTGLTTGSDYTISFDAARTPAEVCSVDRTMWLDVKLLIGADVKETFDWPQSKKCDSSDVCKGMCEVKIEEKPYKRYFWSFKAPGDSVTLRFENTKTGSNVKKFYVWFSHVKIQEGTVTEEEAETAQTKIGTVEAGDKERDAHVIEEQQKLAALKTREDKARQELAAVRRERAHERDKLDGALQSKCPPTLKEAECEDPKRPCLFNGQYCVEVKKPEPGLVNSDFCAFRKKGIPPEKTEDDFQGLGWSYLTELEGWQLGDKDGTSIGEVSFFAADQEDKAKWRKILSGWSLPPLESEHCIGAIVSGKLDESQRVTKKALESRLYMSQTIKTLSKHRYYLEFRAAQSQESTGDWLLVRAVLLGSKVKSDTVEQTFHLSSKEFGTYRFNWIAQGDAYHIEFVSTFDTTPGIKSVIGLASITLLYQASMAVHNHREGPPQPVNAILCNLRGLTQDYIGYSKALSLDGIRAMLPADFDQVCQTKWAQNPPYKDHHSDVGCTSENDCVLCNAVALAHVLGWEWHRKAVSQHFAELLDTPASVVLALLKHPAVFRHNTQTKNWLYDLEMMLKQGDEPQVTCAGSTCHAKCWGPKEFGVQPTNTTTGSGAALYQDSSDSSLVLPELLKKLEEALA